MNNDLQCPRCHQPLSIKEAITMINGSGYARKVRVRMPDGKVHIAEAGMVNPNEVKILEDSPVDQEFLQIMRANSENLELLLSPKTVPG